MNRSALWQRSDDLIWGFRNMYQLEVLEESGQQYPFRGWFFGWAVQDGNPGFPGCDAIFAARSRSLETGWEVYAGRDEWDKEMSPQRWVPVITAQDRYYDEWHNGDPTVVRVRGRYYMAYSSTGRNRDGLDYGQPGDTDGSTLCIMGAVSDDGIRWQRSERPILENLDDYGSPTVPEGDSHLYGSYHRPSLLYENGRFRLWFDYWAGPVFGCSMGYAENAGDFLNPQDWKIVRAGPHPALPQFPNPDVVRVKDLYLAYGDPPNGSPHPWIARHITEAVSLDGLDWLVLGYVDPDPDTPAIHVPQALVRTEDDQIWVYVTYACQIGGGPDYDYRYNKIRLMRRRITAEDLAWYRQLCQNAKPVLEP